MVMSMILEGDSARKYCFLARYV